LTALAEALSNQAIAEGLKLQIRVFGACSPERLTTLVDALDDVGGRAFRIFEDALRDLATSKS